MALRFDRDSGRYRMDDAADLAKALRKLRELQEDKDIQDAIADMEALRKSAAAFMRANDIVKHEGYTLVRPNEKVWALTDEDVPKSGELSHVQSLKSLIGGKIIKRKGKKPLKVFNYITKRVLDKDKLDLAVRKGWLTNDEIKLALYEQPRESYIRRGKVGGTNDDD